MSFTKAALGDFTNVIDRVSKTLKTITGTPSSRTRTSVQAPRQQQPRSSLLQPEQVSPFMSSLLTPQNEQSHMGSMLTPGYTFGGQQRGMNGMLSGQSLFGNIPTINEVLARNQKSFSDSSGVNLPSGGDASQARGLDGTKQYQDIFNKASAESGVPWQVLAAIMGIESGGQNLSANGAGATGVMQVVPKYWQDLANHYGGDLMNPETNIRTAAQIMKQNYDRYGSWEQAAAAYLGAIDKDGNITGATDMFGTSGYTYVDLFKNNLAALGYGNPTNAEAAAGGKAATGWADGAVQAAMSMQGTPYVWGGEDANGFDCSGLVNWAYGQMGKQLPRTAQDQYNATARITSDQLQPGDLIFFKFPAGSVEPGQENIVNHVAIYIGNGQFLQASSNGGVVGIRSLSDAWYAQNIYGYGRVT